MTKHNKGYILTIVLIIAIVTFALSLSACIDLNSIDTITGGGQLSSSNDGNNNSGTDLPTTPNVSYTVETSTGTPNAISNALTDVVSAIQTSVVIINTDVGAGSGVIYGKITDEDASMVITCCHVIDGAKEIKVTINDGDINADNDVILNASLIGMDDDSDLAVLKISGSNYNYVETRNTESAPIVLAEQAIAIGNPLGAGISVTVGHISGISKTINMDGVNMTLLQTDAAVNSGNSGGALFDAEGYLIGIVNAKSTGDSVEGMGYAIPIYDVISISNSLIKTAGNPQFNGLGYIEGKIRLGVVVSMLDYTALSKLNSFGDYLPNTNEFYYFISTSYEINKYGSVAISDKNKTIEPGMLIRALSYTDANGATVRKTFSEDFELADYLAMAKVGGVVTLHMIEEIVTVTGGIFGSYSYSYKEFDVPITLQQYVYGYVG